MTVKEFYEWAVAHKVENAEVSIAEYDECGRYTGYDWLAESGISITEEGKVVEI